MPHSRSYDGVPYSSMSRPTQSVGSRSRSNNSKRSNRSRMQSGRRSNFSRTFSRAGPPKIRRSGPELLLALRRTSPSRSAKRAANMLLDFKSKSPARSPLPDFSSNSARVRERTATPGLFGMRKLF